MARGSCGSCGPPSFALNSASPMLDKVSPAPCARFDSPLPTLEPALLTPCATSDAVFVTALAALESASPALETAFETALLTVLIMPGNPGALGGIFPVRAHSATE